MTHILKSSTFIASSLNTVGLFLAHSVFSFHFRLLHAELHSYRRRRTHTHIGIGNKMHVPTSESKLREGFHSTMFFVFFFLKDSIFLLLQSFCYYFLCRLLSLNHLTLIFQQHALQYMQCSCIIIFIIILYLQTQTFEIPVREFRMLNGINITFSKPRTEYTL